MRLAPTRLVPFSYFCTCWKCRPNASPSFSWLMPSMMRRMRTRLPTYLSTGLGALVDISNTPWHHAGRKKQNRQILLGSVGEEAGNLSNELTGSIFDCQNANCTIGLSTLDCRPPKTGMNLHASRLSLRYAPPKDEKQCGGDNDLCGNVAAARGNGWRHR